MMPLGLLGEGEEAEIVGVRGESASEPEGRRKTDGRVEDMGLRIGKRIEMLANARRGPLLLRVDESRIAVDRGVAMKILVRR